jgi:adenylosuccinate lyase
MISAALGQFGRDCRHLMRSEIDEVRESFGASQVGSSTMAHKRNPITFENLEGTWLKNQIEFGKVLGILISEHQRDLVGSSILRDLPIIVINLQHQLNALNKKKEGVSFLNRIEIDKENCLRNFRANANVILAEPIYIALQIYGYSKDGHELVNRTLMKIAKTENVSLFSALNIYAEKNLEVSQVLRLMPQEMKEALSKPEEYTGLASQKVAETTLRAKMFLATIQ